MVPCFNFASHFPSLVLAWHMLQTHINVTLKNLESVVPSLSLVFFQSYFHLAFVWVRYPVHYVYLDQESSFQIVKFNFFSSFVNI